MPDARRTEEEWWLASHVYSVEARPKSLGPVVERVTWRERYAAPVVGTGGEMAREGNVTLATGQA